ncbi:recombinase family protein [Ruegeria meonggei]|uniref:recombinase family protein n=1 Tax=Ruegeria meonggei TaxID=1446476 RepID=UPI0036726DD1
MASPKIRCAIYTRKSSEEGLEQDFNSLDAQYEACAAFITSQRHEDWKLVRQRYDDGGISGGTMDRPGLRALLADIDAGRVNRIIFYKIDRLTRSLADFAKIVDRLDAADASFVSVTQSFNTATSMGRLTLNMLLSFAQFEREVTAERIRDKIAASKAKGLWMGGTVPLGYDPHPDKTIRGLVINPAEAEDVRRLYQFCVELGSLPKVCAAAERQGIRSKRRSYSSGRKLGGTIMSKGQIHHILTNPIYIGRIKHKSKTYPGKHEAIIEQSVWDEVQATLQARAVKARGAHAGTSNGAMFKGKLFDETGDHLTPSQTSKNGRVLRYYISNRLIRGKDPTGWRLPVSTLEATLTDAIKAALNDSAWHLALLKDADVSEMQVLAARIKDMIDQKAITVAAAADLVTRVDLARENISIALDPDKTADFLTVDLNRIERDHLTLRVTLRLRRRGVEQKILIGDMKPEPNPVLVKCLADAHHWVALLKEGKPLADVAIHADVDPDYIRKRIKLASLSPKIQSAIACGNHPDHWSILSLIRTKIPLGWEAQERLLLAEQSSNSL